MFNRKLKEELEQLKKENENLKNKISRMETAIDNYKLNYLNKKLEVISWERAVQEYVLDKSKDNRFTTFVFYDVAELVNNKLEHLKEQNEMFKYDDGTIDMIKY